MEDKSGVLPMQHDRRHQCNITIMPRRTCRSGGDCGFDPRSLRPSLGRPSSAALPPGPNGKMVAVTLIQWSKSCNIMLHKSRCCARTRLNLAMQIWTHDLLRKPSCFCSIYSVRTIPTGLYDHSTTPIMHYLFIQEHQSEMSLSLCANLFVEPSTQGKWKEYQQQKTTILIHC